MLGCLLWRGIWSSEGFGYSLVVVEPSVHFARKSSVDACIKLHGAMVGKKRAEYLPMFTLYTCDSSSQDTRFQVSTFITISC